MSSAREPSPSVSVVIPAWNAADVLERALQSVFAQTVPVAEIVVVNDGSTDSTAEVMSRFENRIRGFTTANRGAAAARNFGVEQATSEWIAFLDADDQWLPEKMERQWTCLQRNPAAILCYTPMQNIDEQGQAGLIWPEQICEDERDERLLIHWACLAEHPPTPTVLVRRAALLEAGLFPVGLATAEDLDLWVRLLARGKFVGVPAALARRHLHSQSLTATHSQVAQYQRYFQVLRQQREVIRSWLGRHRVNGEAYLHACLANVYSRSGQRSGQLYHSLLALRGWHPHLALAARLLAEAVLGEHLYKLLVGFVKRSAGRPVVSRGAVS